MVFHTPGTVSGCLDIHTSRKLDLQASAMAHTAPSPAPKGHGTAQADAGMPPRHAAAAFIPAPRIFIAGTRPRDYKMKYPRCKR
ncbi:hypothetical protein DA2_3007 [Desulfovibrio sp. A2]|nr:hypothetical protein DA2_3007 [Desulfovibrio sp. A2]